jgi:hypothetical protein
VLEPVVARYRNRTRRRFFRGDAAFDLPELYDYLEAEGYKYTIRLKANAVLQGHIAHLLKRPVGRPPKRVQWFYASFSYQAKSWSRKRRVVAKVEWHSGELYPRVGFIVTNLTRPANRVVAFYNQRGTAEQYIKEGKNAVKWTRLSCRTMKANAVRLQLHALAYNLANFLRTLALPDEMEGWSLTTVREKVVKIGAKVITHARYAVFQMAEVAVPRDLFRRILDMIDDLRPREPAPCRRLKSSIRGERQAKCAHQATKRVGITTQETTKPIRAAFMLRGRLSSRDSAFRLGQNLPTMPSTVGGWAAQMGNVRLKFQGGT